MRFAAAGASATLVLGALAPPARAFVAQAPTGGATRFSRSSGGDVLVAGRRASVGRRPSEMAAATKMAIAGPGDDAKVVVCGPPGGIAGLIAGRLTAAGGIREVVLADETETLEQQPEDAASKRASVAEAIERLINGSERKRGLELSVVSVDGFATTDEEWEE
ncbi:unnamed protein product, partial [Ectocarpus fasciculatus]